jgi:hypothetical protein
LAAVIDSETLFLFFRERETTLRFRTKKKPVSGEENMK